jgi:hypothetical protein
MSIRVLYLKCRQIVRRIKSPEKKELKERFFCPKREENPTSYSSFPNKDKWRVEKNGDLCCSYCGALHPEQFLKFCKVVVDDSDIKKRIEYISNKGKIYIERPTINNAQQGAIKTYNCHIDVWLDTFSKEERVILIGQINAAIDKSKVKYKECFNKKVEPHR